MGKRGPISESREMLGRDVVRDVAIMSAGSLAPPYSSYGLRTIAGGFILAKSGLRILAK